MGESSLRLFANLASSVAFLLLMLLATEAAVLPVRAPPAATGTIHTAASSFNYWNCSDTTGLSCKEVNALQKVVDSLGVQQYTRITGYFCSRLQFDIINTIAIRCNCVTNGVCNIITIKSIGQGLSGSIHEAISELSALQILDLSNNQLGGHIPDKWDSLTNLYFLSLQRNQLTGPIPNSFGSMKNLSELYLNQNFLDGSIPSSLGSISTLTAMSLAFNLLNGAIPEDLGNLINLNFLRLDENRLSGELPTQLGQLVNLTKLWLSGNNFNGSIPPSFANLTKLREFSVAGNSLTGQIPSYIGNWTSLTHLELLGNEFEGPLPIGIFNLTNLYHLWVSDLRNEGFSVPDNANLSNLYTLIIRNSSVNGTIPTCFCIWPWLFHVDLSYNKLTGGIPNSLEGKRLQNLYLMRNNLNGIIPDWIDETVTVEGDLSFNNFSNTEEAINVSHRIKIKPVSRESISKEIIDAKCDKHKSKYDSFYINCGGDELNIHGKRYDSDKSTNDFFISNDGKWGYSISGDFVSTISDHSDYVKNVSCAVSNPESRLHENSRLAPVSLTYYGFCLRNGKYNVELHFAENVYVRDDDYSSQGRRIFDVYIQGKKTLPNFAIKRSFNDTDPQIKTFQARVHDNLMEIQFYWAGKGSIFTPPALNGPLVSAISVTRKSKVKLSKLQIGLIAAASFIVLLILLIIFWFWLKDRELSVTFIDIEGRKYSIRQIIKGTNNFSERMKIYDGDYGEVYKAQLSNHVVAVNKIYHRSKEIIHEMTKEITTFTSFDHENLVKLYGGYFRGDLCLIICECLEPGPLHKVLFGPVSSLQLTWKEKCRICLGMAEGLNYLHENEVIHTNIKDTNVLVARTIQEENFRVKISDFWLAKLYKKDNPFLFEEPKEKYSSLAPEFVMMLKSLTPKVDVYGFGLVALEILSGRKREESHDGEVVYLISRVYELEDKGRLEHDFIDDKPVGFNSRQAKTILSLAMRCIIPAPNVRPPMSEVVARLRETENT